MRNLFSKKVLVRLSIFLLSSTALFAAPKSGKVNLDPAPFKVILDQYYDICENAKGDSINGFDQNSMNKMKKLLGETDDSYIRNKIGNCRSNILGATNNLGRDLLKGQKADLSKSKRVGGIYYNGGTNAYTVHYYYFTTQEKMKSSFQIYFRPKKDLNGNIIWKLI